jgi:hypothetical protein
MVELHGLAKPFEFWGVLPYHQTAPTSLLDAVSVEIGADVLKPCVVVFSMMYVTTLASLSTTGADSRRMYAVA